MPSQAVNHHDVVLAYLRTKYWNVSSQEWEVAALVALRDSTFTAATRTITLTSSSSEAGGAAAGEIVFEKMTLLAALGDLLAEAAPELSPPPSPRGFRADFSQRYSST